MEKTGHYALVYFLSEYVLEKEEYISLDNINCQLTYVLIPKKGEKCLWLEKCYGSTDVSSHFLRGTKISLQGLPSSENLVLTCHMPQRVKTFDYACFGQL